MEESIEVLEIAIDDSKYSFKNFGEYESLDKSTMEAIENLIKGYKELEEQNKQLKVVEKQEKIIDLMAGYLSVVRDCPNEDFGANIDCENRCSNDDNLIKECWKIYFKRQVE